MLFTPVERHFLRNDRKFVLDDNYCSLSASSENFSDISDSAFPTNDDQWKVNSDHAYLPKIMKNAFLPNRPLKKINRLRDGIIELKSRNVHNVLPPGPIEANRSAFN